MTPQHTNALADEKSPYLRQHAHNPVNWVPWSDSALEKASAENKLVLISIGYAACHWCHVMEAECFEDEAVARVMNEHFISIKIDREERPDLDQVYMDALQLMTGAGGWPLNVVALPDGRPFWGATYVKKSQWMQVLEQLAKLYREDPAKVEDYADKLARGIVAINQVEPASEMLLSKQAISNAFDNWSEHFDARMGGNRGAPKFMMPANLELLLHYGTLTPREDLANHLHNTLTRMAWGGIYDHVGGGFSRYSVDARWHVPHFEKLLYDNAQLVSLYAKAFAATANPLYASVCRQTLEFLERELSDGKGSYYASLDADSEGADGEQHEGAFYTWTREALQDLLGTAYPLFAAHYNINAYGRWEAGNYVLIRNGELKDTAKEFGMKEDEAGQLLEDCLEKLFKARQARKAPGLDDKVLTGWNAWMLLALTDAARYLEETQYKERALRLAGRLQEQVVLPDGQLLHQQASSIPGFLEDYAPLALACYRLFELTSDTAYLERSHDLVNYVLQHFADEDSGLFYFTDDHTSYVVRRSLETGDNVIPSSNAVMAEVLYLLASHFPGKGYRDRSEAMISAVQSNLEKYVHGHAHWMRVLLLHQFPFHELVVLGPEFKGPVAQLLREYLPHTTVAGNNEESGSALFKNRLQAGDTLIYHCTEGRCELPRKEVSEVLDRLKA